MPRLADLEVEFLRAESDKYAVPLLLLHGLWTEPRAWRAAASYWSHRGWNCYLPAWRGASRTLADLGARLERVAAQLGTPVVIGHDLGGPLALALTHVAAAVAIAPLPHGPGAPAHPLAGSWRARLARWRGREFVPSGSQAARLYGLDGGRLRPDPSDWFDQLRALELPASSGTPRLIAVGEGDPCLPATSIDAYAAALAADVQRYAGAGHDLPFGAPWQAVVADVHRWIVRRLGADLLLLRGDEDLLDE